MEIIISEQTDPINGSTGYSVSFVNRNKKRSTNDSDFFANGSEVEKQIQKLKGMLKTYFDAQP